jgi:hypothetical protein
MIFEAEFDKELFACISNNAKGHSKHCARNAIHHLERAWSLKEIDPEMAVFRAITAEEEAATAIFLVLKEQGYENAEKIKFKKHSYKQALEPFLRAIGMFADKWSKEPDFPFGSKYELSLEGKDEEKKLSISFNFQEGMITCIPPLGFSIKLNDKQYFFEKELFEITSGKTREDIVKHVERIANRRNELLYAQPNGIPSVSDIDGFLERRRDVVIGFLRIYGLIYPYREKAVFVQQALNAYLTMMGEIEEITEC